MADYNSIHTGQEIDEAVRKVKENDIPAGGVKFSDGETFQQKYDAGELTGPKGDTGAQGPKGDTGDTGPQGQAGADGAPGQDGKSAYESAQDGGYTGTEAEFNAALANSAHFSEIIETISQGQALISDGTGSVSGRAITNLTSTTQTLTANTNLITANTLRYMLNRTGSVAAANTSYTTLMARGSSLHSTETSPSVNGAIAWQYE